jgi:DNA-binding XRE family transcriptional regulator
MNNIKHYRTKADLTQIELSEMLNIAQPTLAQYERGSKFPSSPVWIAMAELFGATVGQLMGTEPIEKEAG